MSDRIIFRSEYFNAPNAVFEFPLTNNEKLTLLYLLRCANNTGAAFPSYKTIGEKCSFTRMTAIRIVESLLKKEFLIKLTRTNKNGDRTSNIYEIMFPSNMMLPPPSNMKLPGSNMMLPNKEISMNDHNNDDRQEKLSTRKKAFESYSKGLK